MSTQKKLITLCIATVFTLGLAACGGGGGGDAPVTGMMDDTTMAPDDTTMDGPMIAGQTVPSGTTVTLPAGTDAPTVTFSAVMDETITVADIGTFTCLTADGCSVAVAGDVITTTGDIEVVSVAVTDADILGQLVAAIAAGEAPKPMAVDLAALTAGYVIPAGTVEIPAGWTVNHGDVALICSGDEACTVTVADDGTATSLGGTVTAENSALYAANLEAARIAAEAADALVAVQEDAAKAATDARTAATDAQTAAGEANTARENRAAIQTGDLHGGSSGAHAKDAQGHADDAETAATDAETASAAAAEATTERAATTALVAVTTALGDATTAKGKADTSRDDAVLAAGKELKIVDKTKMVSDTSIEIDDTARSKTVDGETTTTGLLEDMDIATPGMRDANGLPVRFGDADNDGELDEVSGRTATSSDVAFTYDSSDDTARVTLVHSYLGEEKQMQFVRAGATNPFDGGDDGAPTLLDVTDADDKLADKDGKITIDHDGDGGTTPEVTVAPKLAGDIVNGTVPTETAELYYVETGLEDETADDGIDQTKLFLERDVSTEDGVTTTTYHVVAVIEVTVDNATAFKHLHYGLWNGLEAATKSGHNDIADLGIGFVAQFGEAGMTQDMPNFGDAKYNGNWVANIQEADKQGDGAISRESGVATLDADFVDNKVDVVLSGLASLEGTIDESTFSGEGKPTLNATGLPGGLATADDFMGSFSGAFFGPKAAEAGGVFDYASKDNKNGAFRGSFGGTR